MALAEAGYFDDAFQMADLVDPEQDDFFTGGKRRYVITELRVSDCKLLEGS